MLVPMLLLAGAGLALLFAAPVLARLSTGRGRDPIGMTRVLQLIAVALLVVALLVRPRNPETTAIPPPPDVTDTIDR